MFTLLTPQKPISYSIGEHVNRIKVVLLLTSIYLTIKSASNKLFRFPYWRMSNTSECVFSLFWITGSQARLLITSSKSIEESFTLPPYLYSQYSISKCKSLLTSLLSCFNPIHRSQFIFRCLKSLTWLHSLDV